MKILLRHLLIICLLSGISTTHAQQVNTLYFLENSPMRHVINPAFQPVSKMYLTLPALGYTSIWAGNNALTMRDCLFKDPKTGHTITPLHPNADPNWLKHKPNMILVDADVYVNILGFGYRVQDFGYATVNISERVLAGASFNKSLLGVNELSTSAIGPLTIGANAIAYTDIALGYSHKINDQWTVGGKFKLLVGEAYADAEIKKLTITSDYEQLTAFGEGSITAAAPLLWEQLPTDIEDFSGIEFSSLISSDIRDLLKPAGMGAALDLGMTYKPFDMLQVTASITDMGFINWTRLARGTMAIDTTFCGIELEAKDYMQNNQFQLDNLTSDLSNELMGYSDALQITGIKKNKSFASALVANLNIGVDAYFWEDRIGVGLYSRTRFYKHTAIEELTLGAAFRPFNWFNIAASYSFINGHWSNIGAGLSIAPYDGLMLTFATDYVPMTYATASFENNTISLPYKTAGINLSFGLAIVVGTNQQKKSNQSLSVDNQLTISQ